MSGLPPKYARQDWFGPESFVAVVVGMVCVALPYAGLVPREATWLIWGPPLVGILLIASSAAGSAFAGSLRRAGVGLVLAFAGFVLAIPGLLLGIALGTSFT
ncbi:hypothetical protein [Nocardia blacklockiae]|uniref:hypothetical protein n=1 Tax=Nocardia blacklockiae TaxID=480036 RepID=UPI00189547EA|nr:hypothetical protein [Nocardia blacklockiae]MBF6173829.1 hypothetical protein [Nocardia blacklockiae]